MEIKLTQDKVALVDDCDFEWLNQWKWYARLDPRTGFFYAQRGRQFHEGQRVVQMHREILGLCRGDRRIADHVNRDTLDNRRENLRIATFSQNRANSKTSAASGLKGAYWRKDLLKWQAQIRVARKCKSLGFFDSAEEAHSVYCEAATKQFGEFARFDGGKKKN